MGVDNESKLIFGMVLSSENADKIVSKIAETNVEFTRDDLRAYATGDYEGNSPFNAFPNIFWGYTCPYFDCDVGDTLLHITFCSRETQVSLDELQQLMNDMPAILLQYQEFLRFHNIDYAPPVLVSLPHIH